MNRTASVFTGRIGPLSLREGLLPLHSFLFFSEDCDLLLLSIRVLVEILKLLLLLSRSQGLVITPWTVWGAEKLRCKGKGLSALLFLDYLLQLNILLNLFVVLIKPLKYQLWVLVLLVLIVHRTLQMLDCYPLWSEGTSVDFFSRLYLLPLSLYLRPYLILLK